MRLGHVDSGGDFIYFWSWPNNGRFCLPALPARCVYSNTFLVRLFARTMRLHN
jgi:hypothetical protein